MLMNILLILISSFAFYLNYVFLNDPPTINILWERNLMDMDERIGNLMSICYNGRLIGYDDQSKGIFYINQKNGDLDWIETFSEGRGPGEIIEASQIACDDENLYLLDWVQHKLIQYDLQEGEIQAEQTVDTYLNWVSKLVQIEGELFVNNYDPENHFFYTRLNDGKKIIRPFEEGDIPGYAIRAMEQLTQSSLLFYDNYYYHFLQAPYRVTKYDKNFQEVEIITDERSVDPWQNHIFANEVRYRVGQYPKADCFQVYDKAVCAYYVYDDGISFIDVWSLTGLNKIASIENEINKEEIKYFLIEALPGKSDNEMLLIFVNYDELDIKMASLNLNQ